MQSLYSCVGACYDRHSVSTYELPTIQPNTHKLHGLRQLGWLSPLGGRNRAGLHLWSGCSRIYFSLLRSVVGDGVRVCVEQLRIDVDRVGERCDESREAVVGTGTELKHCRGHVLSHHLRTCRRPNGAIEAAERKHETTQENRGYTVCMRVCQGMMQVPQMAWVTYGSMNRSHSAPTLRASTET